MYGYIFTAVYRSANTTSISSDDCGINIGNNKHGCTKRTPSTTIMIVTTKAMTLTTVTPRPI
jgi:hypothetical protein